jgi:hypothetical protein
MKTNFNLLQTRIVCVVALGIGLFFGLAAATENSADTASATTAIPWSHLAAKAGADYQGDGLAVIPTAEGARLRCVFQQLEGEATREGLWLTSTVIPPGGTVNDRFRLLAVEVGRGTPCAPSAVGGATDRKANIQPSTSGVQLSASGTVSIDSQTVRFTRPGLVEEYTASMDGVRLFQKITRVRGGAEQGRDPSTHQRGQTIYFCVIHSLLRSKSQTGMKKLMV